MKTIKILLSVAVLFALTPGAFARVSANKTGSKGYKRPGAAPNVAKVGGKAALPVANANAKKAVQLLVLKSSGMAQRITKAMNANPSVKSFVNTIVQNKEMTSKANKKYTQAVLQFAITFGVIFQVMPASQNRALGAALLFRAEEAITGNGWEQASRDGFLKFITAFNSTYAIHIKSKKSHKIAYELALNSAAVALTGNGGQLSKIAKKLNEIREECKRG